VEERKNSNPQPSMSGCLLHGSTYQAATHSMAARGKSSHNLSTFDGLAVLSGRTESTILVDCYPRLLILFVAGGIVCRSAKS